MLRRRRPSRIDAPTASIRCHLLGTILSSSSAPTLFDSSVFVSSKDALLDSTPGDKKGCPPSIFSRSCNTSPSRSAYLACDSSKDFCRAVIDSAASVVGWSSSTYGLLSLSLPAAPAEQKKKSLKLHVHKIIFPGLPSLKVNHWSLYIASVQHAPLLRFLHMFNTAQNSPLIKMCQHYCILRGEENES